MGNRAVITDKNKQIGVYVHWNGGRTSVEGFLTYCRLKEYRNPNDDYYGWARLCQVIGNFFGGELSVGIGIYEYLDTDNGDNGVYVMDENWNICERIYADGCNEKVDKQKLYEFIVALNEEQPEKEQIKEEIIKKEIFGEEDKNV